MIDLLSPFRRMSDDTLAVWHRWAIRYVHCSSLVFLIVVPVHVLTWLAAGVSLLNWPLALTGWLMLAGWVVAFYGVCGLCGREEKRRDWVFPEWVQTRWGYWRPER